MDIAKIGWGLGTLAAVVLTFVNTGHDGTILAVLGLIAGYASAAAADLHQDLQPRDAFESPR